MVQSRYVDMGQARLHHIQGGSGPPVMLLHGFLGAAESWRYQLQTLPSAGWSVVAPDLPGFGESRLSWEYDHSHMALARYCAGLIQRLGLPPVHLVGHSMGGKVALWLALKAPHLVGTLTLVAPAVFSNPTAHFSRVPGLVWAARWLLRSRWSREARFRADLERFYGVPVPEEIAADYWRRYRQTEVQAGALAHVRDSTRGPSILSYLSEVRVPVHLIWGEGDEVFPLDQAKNLCHLLKKAPGRASITVLPGVGHFPHELEPARFNGALLSFLNPYRQKARAQG